MTKVRVIGLPVDDPALAELLQDAECEILHDDDQAAQDAASNEEEAAPRDESPRMMTATSS